MKAIGNLHFSGTRSAASKWAGIFLALLLLLGCGSKNVPPASGSTESSGASAQVRESTAEKTGEKADRYAEIIDRSSEKGKLTVFFLDLSVKNEQTDKSGDAALLISPDGKVMMIDSGHPESAPDILKFLSDMGIGKIDCFVLSHPHIDHIGGFPAIAEKHPIGKVYQIDMDYPTDTYRKTQEAIKAKNIPLVYLKDGDTLRFGDKVGIEIFNPGESLEYPQNFPDNSTQFVNNASMVMKFSYGTSTYLTAGDIYSPKERDLTDIFGEELRADVAKANHHGADTSNSNRWIRTVQPLIVVSMHDVMGSMTVYNNYVKQGSAYYHSLYDGIIRISMDDESNYTALTQFDSWLRPE